MLVDIDSTSTTFAIESVEIFDYYDNLIYASEEALGSATLGVESSTIKLATSEFNTENWQRSKRLYEVGPIPKGFLWWDISGLTAADFDDGTTVKIYFPVSTGRLQDKAFYVKDDSYLKKLFMKTPILDIDNNDLLDAFEKNSNYAALSSPTLFSGDRNTGYISFGFESSANTYLGGTGEKVWFALDNEGTNDIANPLVATNWETRYQTYIEIKNSKTDKNYYAVAQFDILAREWASASMDASVIAAIDGIPISITLGRNGIDFPPTTESGRTYYVDLYFNVYIGQVKYDYPCYLDSGDDESLSCTAGGSILTVQGLALDTNYNEAVIYLTIGDMTPGDPVTVDITGYYTEDDDIDQIRYITYQTNRVAGFTPIDPATPDGSASVTGLPGVLEKSTDTLAITHGLVAEDNYVETLALIVHGGFKFDSPTLTFTDGISNHVPDSLVKPANLFIFNTPNWATVLAIETDMNSTPGEDDDGAELPILTVAGLVGPKYVPDHVDLYLLLGKYPFDNIDHSKASGSVYTSALNERIKPGVITLLETSATNNRKRSSESLHTDVTIKFQITTPYASYNEIIIEFNSDWEYTERYELDCMTCNGQVLESGCSFESNTYRIFNYENLAENAIITVLLPKLMPPKATSSEAGSKYFVVSITSYTSKNYFNTNGYYSVDFIIDETPDLSLNVKNELVILGGETMGPGVSTIEEYTTIPDNAGLTQVDLYLSFSFNRDIPDGGTITLSTTLTWTISKSDDISHICFLNGIEYSSCEKTDAGVVITLNDDYESGHQLELYIEGAVNNPGTTAAFANAFAFKVDYFGVVLINDINPPSFTASPPISALKDLDAGMSEVSVDVLNAGESATYTFTLISPEVVSIDDQIWLVFPEEYDHYLGDANRWFESKDNVYSIACASKELGTVWCAADHRMLVVKGDTKVEANTQISIEVYDIKNPAYTSTPTEFTVYHYSVEKGRVVAGDQSYGSITFADTPDGFIYIKSVSSKNNKLSGTVDDFYLEFYILNYALTEKDEIGVVFPRQWELLHDADKTVDCSTTILEETDSSTNFAEDADDWIKSAKCSVSGNYVKLDLNEGQGQTFDGYDKRIGFSISNVESPEWAYGRLEDVNIDSDYYDEWDLAFTDENVFDLYDYYTNKFSVFVYDSNSKTISCISYPETNVAYLGYEDSGRLLYVHGYTSIDDDADSELGVFDPATWSNRIIVHAGTQTTDLSITTESEDLLFASKSLTLSPTVLDFVVGDGSAEDVSVTSEYDFTFFEDDYEITFRVSADIDAALGLYVIDWEITEEVTQLGVENAQYQRPVKTLVEVVANSDAVYDFDFDKLPKIYPGEETVFISVYLGHSPHTEVTLTLSFAESTQSTKLTVSPSTLRFVPDVNVRYFTIEVGDDYEVSTTAESLTFTIGGTDAAAYNEPENLSILVQDGSTEAGEITSFNIDDDSYPVSINPTTSKEGILFFYVTVEYTESPTLEDITTYFDDYFLGEDDTSAKLHRVEGRFLEEEDEDDQREEETWGDYQLRKYKAHIQSIYVDFLFANAKGKTEEITIDWLWDNTEYKVGGYLVTGSVASEELVEPFSTSRWNLPLEFDIEIEGTADGEDEVEIILRASVIMGINPSRVHIADNDPSETTRKLAETSTITLNLLQHRGIHSPSTIEYAEDLVDHEELYRSELANAGITLKSISDPKEMTPGIPSFTKSPSVTNETEDSLTVQFQATIEGTVACIADTTGEKPTVNQIYAGLNAANKEVPYTWGETDITEDINELTINGLDAGTTYTVYCVATDALPLWPTLQEDSASDQGTTLSVEVDEDGSSASYISALLILLVAFLIN